MPVEVTTRDGIRHNVKACSSHGTKNTDKFKKCPLPWDVEMHGGVLKISVQCNFQVDYKLGNVQVVQRMGF